MAFLTGKFFAMQRRFAKAEATFFTLQKAPELRSAYSAFVHASQISASRQPYKGRDVWRLLEKHSPLSIVELGSGTTSAVFALWAARHGARYVAYEDNLKWAEVTRHCLGQAGMLSASGSSIRVVASRIRDDGQATGFVEPIPLDADFVYVDGPPARLPDGRKVPNDDIPRLFDAGGMPSVIVVDGRLDTVDLIRQHPAGKHYSFAPSFVYCQRHGLWTAALACREHSVFRLHRRSDVAAS